MTHRLWAFVAAGFLVSALSINSAIASEAVPASPPVALGQPTQPVSTVPALPENGLPGLSNFATVSADLYRGAQPTAEGFRTLARLGIKTVVNLRAFHDDAKLIQGTGLDYVHITFEPWNPERGEVLSFLKIMADPLRRPVFVHCQHGADRTGTMVAAYRMVFQRWSLDQALVELPNFGFHRIWSNLKTFLRSLSSDELRRSLEAGTPAK